MNYWYKLEVSVFKSLGPAASHKRIFPFSCLCVWMFMHAHGYTRVRPLRKKKRRNATFLQYGFWLKIFGKKLLVLERGIL